MQLTDLQACLLSVTSKTYHLEKAKGESGDYIVWAEDGEADSSSADNKKQQQTLTGTIDYFTRVEFDPVFGQIQAALNGLGISWRLNSIQKETDTGYIHYEWVWKIPQAVS